MVMETGASSQGTGFAALSRLRARRRQNETFCGQKDPDYHNVVHYVDQVRLGGAKLDHCLHIATKKGEAKCITLGKDGRPKVSQDKASVETHIVKGKIDLILALAPTQDRLEAFLELKKDWEALYNVDTKGDSHAT